MPPDAPTSPRPTGAGARVAVTLTQLWHRVPGGTATSVLELLTSLAERLLEVEAPLIEEAVAAEIARGGEVIADTIGSETCLFLRGLHGAERAIAERLAARAGRNPPWPEIE